LILSHLGELRRSLERPDAYEIECWFTPESDRSRLIQSWAPFEQLGQLVSGAAYDQGELVGIAGHPHELHTRNLVATGTARLEPIGASPPIFHIGAAGDSGPDSYLLEDLTTIAHEPWGQRHVEPVVCIGEDDGTPVFIPSGELLRFYFGPLSLGANAFMTAAAQEAGEDLVNFESTEFIDDGVFRIAPHESLLDRGSALHLALLLASEDLRQLWMDTTLGLAFAHGRESPPYPVVVAPSEATSLRLAGRYVDVQIGMLPVRQSGFKASRILSDSRKAPFKKLIVRLPKTGFRDPEDRAVEDLPEMERRRAVLKPVLSFDQRRRPGLSAIKRSSLFQSVLSAFPALSSVKVAYEQAPSTAAQRRRMLVDKPTEVETLSMLPAGGRDDVGSLVFRPQRCSDPDILEEAGVERLLTYDAEVAEAKVVSVPVSDLAFPLPSFIQAFAVLARVGGGSLVLQDPVGSLAGEVALLEAPPCWLGSKRASRRRKAAVAMIPVEGSPVYAFELERLSRHERISLFLVTRRDGQPLSRRDMSSVFRHAVLRLADQRRDEDRERGIWPCRGFADVIGRTVPHKGRRRFASCLAEDLDDLARGLILLLRDRVLSAPGSS
jgi:hypothetical protein